MRTLSRRTVLQWLKGLGILALTSFGTITEALARHFPTRTVERKNFRFDARTGSIIWTDTRDEEPYRLKLEGLVETPVELSYADLLNMESADQTSDFHCVEGWSVRAVRWSGIRFSEILKRVKPSPDAEYVTFHSLGETHHKPREQDHYVESFKLASLIDPEQDILLVLKMDDKPLSIERGAPMRVIAPYRLAYKSIKFVHRIEFAKKRQYGWWTLANPVYSWEALVSKSRLRKK